jgi:hypothetical protein
MGGTTDVSGWWERKNFPKDSSDYALVIDNEYHLKPYLLAYDMYGDAAYDWFILQYNNILDAQSEFIVGKTIKLPTPERFKGIK